MTDLTDCPTCGSPAEVEDSTVMASTGGVVVLRKMRCVLGHWWHDTHDVDVYGSRREW